MSPSATRSARILTVLLLCVVICLRTAAMSAHDVVVEQIVDMRVQVQATRLAVHVHVPVTVLADAQLPRFADAPPDEATLDGALRIVAADVARSLDFRQDDAALEPPTIGARVGADRASVDVDLTYPIDGTSTGFSARLNGFQGSALQPVRTNVSYEPPAGPRQTVSVTGLPIRVRFDPGAFETLQKFITAALSSVLTGGDHVLWLVCLLLPARRAREAARLVAATMGGQALSIAAAATLFPRTAPALTPPAAMIAASVVVIAALQNIVRARVYWVALLALGFGVLNGFAFGEAFTIGRQLAGSHQLIAFAAFLAVVLTGQLWLGSVMWATRAWLDRRGMPDRIATMTVSVLIAHAAVHRTIDRGHALAQGQVFEPGRALMWLALGWALAMSIVAAVEWLRARHVPGQPDRMSSHVQA